jgi:hypothetical protein
MITVRPFGNTYFSKGMTISFPFFSTFCTSFACENDIELIKKINKNNETIFFIKEFLVMLQYNRYPEKNHKLYMNGEEKV